MPEGPEIRLAADKVARVLVGHIIVDAEFYLGRLSRFEKRLAGSAVTAVDTRGKAMLTRFDNGLTLYSHNQLYGKWFTMRRPRLPRTTRQLRVGLHTETHSALLYSASEIEVLTERSLKKHPFLCRVGPDILDPELTADGIVELHVIAKETLAISQRSYRTRGVTTPPKQAKERKARGMSYGQYRFQVFGREGLDCYACGTTIERHTLGSRNLFVCPGCQWNSSTDKL